MKTLLTGTVPPPDDASDLWGKAPTRPRRCQGCNLNAEIYDPVTQCCWTCCVTGRSNLVVAAMVESKTPRLCLPAGAGGVR